MTSLFPDLRSELVGAMERGPRRRRAPLLAAAIVVLAAIAALAGASRLDRPARPAATPAPVDVSDLPPSIAGTLLDGTAGRQPGTPRVELRLNADFAWTFIAYHARNGTLSTTSAPDALRRPPAPARGTSPALPELLRREHVVALDVQGVRYLGRPFFVISGLVDAGVRAASITVKNVGGAMWTSDAR